MQYKRVFSVESSFRFFCKELHKIRSSSVRKNVQGKQGAAYDNVRLVMSQLFLFLSLALLFLARAGAPLEIAHGTACTARNVQSQGFHAIQRRR